MASKQEKLAAARRKLKEFQGKQREGDSSKGSIVSGNLDPVRSPVQDSSSSASGKSSPMFHHQNYFEQDKKPHLIHHVEDSKEAMESYKRPPNSPTNWPEEGQNVCNNSQRIFTPGNISALDSVHLIKSNFQMESSLLESNRSGLFNSPINASEKLGYLSSNAKSTGEVSIDKSGSITPELDNHKWSPSLQQTNIFPQRENVPPLSQKELRDYSGAMSNNALNEVIRPLQTELQNHAQTINILVQQRNEAQTALGHAQNMLSEKSGEISQQAQQIASLTVIINDLNKRLSESEFAVKNLNLQNEAKSHQISETGSALQALRSQFESKDEECLEMKRKYEEKCKECQQLLYSLNETQSQLSLCQIQLQNQTPQTTDEKSDVMVRFSKLENENFNLSQQLEVTRRELEAAQVEKDQSSQNFKVYAQQCNAELEALNSQIKELTASNEKLKRMNEVIPGNGPEKVVNGIEENPVLDEYKNEIANLHGQISELTEAKNELQVNCQKLKEEVLVVRNEFALREMEAKKATEALKELEGENKRLLLEAESPKADERLLAAIESDKVAAAKAVSQNQKLKSQVMELEEAFVKLSEEKLELTNQLAHEKYLKKELQTRLDSQECHRHEENHDHHQHHHHHHHDGDEHHGCRDESEHGHGNDREPLVNDSQEIDELKRIIRQLQEDKMELKSRLNSVDGVSSQREGEKDEESIPGGPGAENEEVQGEENAKVRLQQMEEKVRKTMNEIAKLDEEKEKLEHLVLQLQGETETIGEYIALYQKQRMLLKQRSQEKDIQLNQLSKDKEELKAKLKDLDGLVQHLLQEKNAEKPGEDVASSPRPDGQPEETAVKIRALINEIGSTNLISNQSLAFKHCSCCSGRLITI